MSDITNDVYIVDADAGGGSGVLILLTGTTVGSATLLHTATADADTWDELYIWGNQLGSDVSVTVCFGGTAAKDRVFASITAGSPPKCLVPGWKLRGGLPVWGFASAASGASVKVNVNRTVKKVS